MSKLEKYLSSKIYSRFSHLSTRQNYRPEWLDGLELDFYIEELRIAAEVQGDQHFSFVEFFHKTKENFEAQKNRDALKSIICMERGIKLFEIFTEKDADLFLQFIDDKTNTVTHQLPEILRLQKNNSKMLKGLIKGYNKASRNLWLHEHGIIIASEEKVRTWKNVVSKGVKIKGTRHG